MEKDKNFIQKTGSLFCFISYILLFLLSRYLWARCIDISDNVNIIAISVCIIGFILIFLESKSVLQRICKIVVGVCCVFIVLTWEPGVVSSGWYTMKEVHDEEGEFVLLEEDSYTIKCSPDVCENIMEGKRYDVRFRRVNIIKTYAFLEGEIDIEKTENPDGMDEYYIPQDYERYFAEEFAKYRFDDIAEWKDSEGNWCYPKGFDIMMTPSVDSVMAAQQFPKELLEDLDTEELFSFIMQYPGMFMIIAYDDSFHALSTYRSCYNFIDELMSREDCAEVVHRHYETYTEEEREMYSKEGVLANSDMDAEDRFQLVEAMEMYFTGQFK